MDRGAWQATIHRVAKSRTGLSDFTSSLYSNGQSLAQIIWIKMGGWVCTLSLFVVQPGATQPWGLWTICQDLWCIPRGLMPRRTFQECCCQCPHPPGKSLPIHASTVDPLPSLAGSFGSVSCGVTAPFLWLLVHATFCLCPPRLESLFSPVLRKSYNQIPLAFKVRFPGDSQPLFQIPSLGSLKRGSEPSQQCSSQHCLSQPEHGSNLDAHQQTNGQGSCGTYTPWNITQPLKRIHLNQF